MRRFVTDLQTQVIPNPAGYGRTLRMLIDVDMNAVSDYVMFEGKGDEPWPHKVLEEMLEAFMLEARKEQAIQEMLSARNRRKGQGE